MVAFTFLQENMKKPITAFSSAYYRLCVCASGSLITVVFRCFTLIKVSCLHLGQNSGKYFSSVSPRIFSLVLFPQTGQRNHSEITFSISVILPVVILIFRECLCENKRISNSNCKQYQLEDDTLFYRQSYHICKNTCDVNCGVRNYAREQTTATIIKNDKQKTNRNRIIAVFTLSFAIALKSSPLKITSSKNPTQSIQAI